MYKLNIINLHDLVSSSMAQFSKSFSLQLCETHSYTSLMGMTFMK